MKKIVCILLLTSIFSSCDDGNLKVENINFDDAKVQSCTNGIIYKLNDNESMLLQMRDSVPNEPSRPGVPMQYNIDNISNRVIYRAYNGTVTTDNICSTIPPATPTVTDQWTATGGTIEIFTSQTVSTDNTNNSTRITGYSHNITFKNITFLKSDGPQVYKDFDFGAYTTTVPALDLTFKTTAEQCPQSKQVYNYDTGASITIDNIDPNLLLNEPTLANAPRIGLISDTTNKLSYKVYENGILSAGYFCNATTPITPVVTQTWLGVNGVQGISGIIQVQTETFGPNTFKHTITLKSVTLQKGNSSFKLGDNYLFGELYLTK